MRFLRTSRLNYVMIETAFTLHIVIGLASLLAPSVISRTLGYAPLSPLGRTEFKATYGAFFLALGIGGLWLNSSDAALLVGLAWFSAGLMRAVSLVIGRNNLKEHSFGVGVEWGIASLLLLS